MGFWVGLEALEVEGQQIDSFCECANSKVTAVLYLLHSGVIVGVDVRLHP